MDWSRFWREVAAFVGWVSTHPPHRKHHPHHPHPHRRKRLRHITIDLRVAC